MRCSTAVRTRLPGTLLVVVLLTGFHFFGLSPASAGEPDPVGVWPLSPVPVVAERFDPPSSPWGSGHRGVDLLGHLGQPVLAALPGRVRFAGVLAGRGVIVVDHGETRTTYEPVAATVHVGDPVSAGARIGTLASALSHCRPSTCLHWGWIRNADDVYLDPLLLVGAGRVRLLPLWRDRPADAPGPLRGPVLRPIRSELPPPSLRPTTAYAAWRPLVDLLAPPA
jgi:murein DD-endopeptidase MepM/ murein hydrolase activator NlpD